MTARTPIDEARLRELWRGSMSTVAIGAALGCSYVTVYKYAKDLKLPMPRYVSGEAKRASAKPAPIALQDRPDYPRIVAAVQRGVSIQWAAAVFRLPYAAVAEMAGRG